MKYYFRHMPENQGKKMSNAPFILQEWVFPAG
jgi:hypothetical protein